MELRFDSINELEQFLMFSAHIGAAFATQTPQTAAIAALDAYANAGYPGAQPPADMPEGTAHIAEAEVFAQGEDGPLVADGGDAKPKRTRRTKAEMEAARAADALAELNAGAESDPLTPGVVGPATSPNPVDANPFAVASPATQAILEAPNQSAATLAGIAAMQTAPVDEAPAAPRVIESIEHLRACQSFIQEHGMTKYNESFRDGLNANIAAYTPEQRSLHVSILSQLAA